MKKIAEIPEGQSIELLKALHILTRDGKLNQDSRRKLKQVAHLVQLIEPLLHAAAAQHGTATLIDHGAGKSYLGFMLYDAFVGMRGGKALIVGVESREELVLKSRELAQQLGFSGMRFVNSSVAASHHASDMPERLDIVTALHACNTATDDALSFALAHRASAVVLVPCCQAEVAAALNRGKTQALRNASFGAFTELWRHPLHTREFGSQVTNVLRCLRLEAAGYQVTVTELVGWEHALKNELILARRQAHVDRQARAQKRLNEMLSQLGLNELKARFSVDPQARIE